MTHDLIFNMARHFDLELLEVFINDLQEGIFYANLVIEADGDVHEIDSRPSDAVAIGVRFKVPIFCAEQVLDEAGIVIEDEGNTDNENEFSLAEIESSEPVEEEPEAPAPAPAAKSSNASKEAITKLQKQLEEALAGEDYEKAARIRDEILRLESGAS